jgi:hypothetical protein
MSKQDVWRKPYLSLVHSKSAVCLGMELLVNWDDRKITQCVSLAQPYKLVEIDMQRFRDVCNFAKYKNGTQFQCKVMERLRGRKS